MEELRGCKIAKRMKGKKYSGRDEVTKETIIS
jgi:hypothetical protein